MNLKYLSRYQFLERLLVAKSSSPPWISRRSQGTCVQNSGTIKILSKTHKCKRYLWCLDLGERTTEECDDEFLDGVRMITSISMLEFIADVGRRAISDVDRKKG
jgi:hypothetical protein